MSLVVYTAVRTSGALRFDLGLTPSEPNPVAGDTTVVGDGG